MTRRSALLMLLMLGGCGRAPAPDRTEPRASAVPIAPAKPIPPGEPGGLPDDRTPIPEGRIDPDGAQGAAQVVQHFYALVESRRYDEARALWPGNGVGPEAFARQFSRYRDYHAQIGAPGRMEGAAGSLYVEVPVQTYGSRTDGTPFRQGETVTLRRVNDVPGSTAEQRRWHIASIALSPA